MCINIYANQDIHIGLCESVYVYTPMRIYVWYYLINIYKQTNM